MRSVYIAATLLLVIELVKTYEDALKIDIGMVDNVFFAAASFAANALLCWFMFRVVHGVVGTKPSKARVTAYGVISLLLGALGAAKEVVLTFILWNVDYAALLGLHAYCAVLLYRGLKSIEPPLVRSLIRTLLIYLAIFAPLAVAQLVLQDIPSSPPAVHDWPLEELLYYLGFVIIAVVYLARYFLEPGAEHPVVLESRLLERFGISKREADIISMMIKGHSNRSIGEKLFISASTVKNHIYHIYQKTGVDNKIQLLNLLNPPK